MIRKFLRRLALLGVSYLVCQLGILETTSKAYMYIDLALAGFATLVCFTIISFIGAVVEENNLVSVAKGHFVLGFAVSTAIELGLAWLIAKFTSLDFFYFVRCGRFYLLPYS